MASDTIKQLRVWPKDDLIIGWWCPMCAVQNFVALTDHKTRAWCKCCNKPTDLILEK